MARRSGAGGGLPTRTVLGALGLGMLAVFFAGGTLGIEVASAPTGVVALLAGVILVLAAVLWERFPPFMQAFGAVLAWIVAFVFVLEAGALLVLSGTDDSPEIRDDGPGRFRSSWDPYLGTRTVPYGGWVPSPAMPAMRPVPGVPPDSLEAFEVWLLGGDMAWSGPLSDDSTVAAALQRQLDGRMTQPVRVVCAAQPGYVTTQELIQLALGLRDGGRPDLVVCLHGYDDILSAHSSSVTGDPLRMTRMRQEAADQFTLGDLIETSTGLGKLVRDIARGEEEEEDLSSHGGIPPEVMAGRTVRTALANQGLISAMAGEHGARTAFFWQPVESGSRVETSERQDLREIAATDGELLAELVESVYARMDTISTELPGTWVVRASQLGGGELFIDKGVLTGSAAEALAELMADRLAEAGLI